MTEARRNVNCASCGALNIGEHDACLLCGGQLVPAATSAPSPALPRPVADVVRPMCPECGALVREGLKFCTQCGTQLEGTADG